MRILALVQFCIIQLSAPLFCQILQNHPELCGDKRNPAQAPPGLVATIDRSNSTATLEYGSGATMLLEGANDEIQEVCPLASGKVAVFGYNYVGYEINIVDLAHMQVADSFLAYDPMMSPNRRWLASRHFYPPQSEVLASEEYLLYDLGASAAQNRHNATSYTADAAGWAMCPAFPDYAPADLLDISEAKKHFWRSKSFYWAPDSRSVAFADSVGEQLALILVEALIDTLPGNNLNITVTFEDAGYAPGCQPRRRTLSLADFQPAKVESYEHRNLKKAVPGKVVR